MAEEEQSRRRFLQAAGIGAAVSLAAASSSVGKVVNSAPRKAGKPQFELGLASYTLRKLNLDDTLAITKRLELKYICFKSFHLPLDSSGEHIKQVLAKVEAAGLKLYGGGVIGMKNAEQIEHAFEYARAAGMTVIVAAPAPDMLGLIDKKIKQYDDIKVAIHNHGPGDKYFPVPSAAYKQIKNLDERIGICHDIGHTQRMGVDPSAETKKCADRIFDIHMKDVSAADAKGHGVEIGRGVMDIPKVLKTLIKINYSGVVSYEYEKDADGPLAGLAESVGYVRGVLAAIS